MQQQNRSEVARKREQIEAEYEAARHALHGPAMVGGHNFIEARFTSFAQSVKRLRGLVGDQEARRMADHAFDDDDLELHIQESIDNGDFDWWSSPEKGE